MCIYIYFIFYWRLFGIYIHLLVTWSQESATAQPILSTLPIPRYFNCPFQVNIMSRFSRSGSKTSGSGKTLRSPDDVRFITKMASDMAKRCEMTNTKALRSTQCVCGWTKGIQRAQGLHHIFSAKGFDTLLLNDGLNTPCASSRRFKVSLWAPFTYFTCRYLSCIFSLCIGMHRLFYGHVWYAHLPVTVRHGNTTTCQFQRHDWACLKIGKYPPNGLKTFEKNDDLRYT